MMIRFALTGKMIDEPIKKKITPYWEEYACNVTFLVSPGTIAEIRGVDEILKIPGVIDAVLAHVEGDEIPETAKGTLRQIILRVFATAKSNHELEDLLTRINGALRVISVEGESMLLDGFDTLELGGLLI